MFQLKILPLVAALLLTLPQPSQAQLSPKQIDSLEALLSRSQDDTNKVKLLVTLTNEVGYTSLTKALEYAQQGYALAQKLGYKYGEGILAYGQGTTYAEMARHHLADSFLMIAENIFVDMNDKKNLAKIDNARGGIHYMRGNYLVSGEYYTKAATGFDEIKDTTLSLIAYQNLISVLGQIKNYEKAVTLAEKILPIAEEGNDPLQVGYTLQSLVTNLVYLGRMDEAASHIERLLNIANTSGDENLSAEIYGTVGLYYYKLEDFTRAEDHFFTASQKAESLNNMFQLAHHFNALGQAYYRAGKFREAKEYLEKAKALAEHHNDKRAASNVALSLSTLYDSLRDYRNAFQNLSFHARLKDSILNNETVSYTTHLEAKYESNRKENEILRLQQVQREKEFQIQTRNTMLAIGLSLIAILTIILYLLRRNYRHRQKLNAKEAALLQEKIKSIEKEQQISSLQSMINGQETERTRIARDLHDGLGGVFSTIKMHYSTLQRDTPQLKENAIYRKTLDLINSASDELRRVAHNMMPEVLMKVGMIEALTDFCHNVSSGRLLKVTMQAYGMEKRLSASTEIMLYRIIQELVNNIIKHADATEAVIQIVRDGNRLSLTIEDNGKGFDTMEAEEKRSMGMATVRSRVDYLNGKITIDSNKNIGTTVMIDLLLNEN